MSDLSYLERNQLEKLFDMGGGYVLDFSNRTFQEFVSDSVSIDIDNPKYNYHSGSKANRLRQFFKIESNYNVGRLISDIVAYAATFPDTLTQINQLRCSINSPVVRILRRYRSVFL